MQQLDFPHDAALQGAYLAIGSFDGVHRGHRQLLAQMIQSAREDHAPAVVLTFFPHPRIVLGQNPAAPPFRYLTTLQDRIALLKSLALDGVVVQTFDLPFSHIPVAEFVDTLRSRLGLRALWCGPEFALGYRREGNISSLAEYGLQTGFSLYIVPPLEEAGEPVTSTRIRAALTQGDPAGASRLLGRRYSLVGKVVHGSGRGRRTGVPTANMETWNELVIPARGVYATRVEVKGRRYTGVTNIGLRPTFGGDSAPDSTVETHILDFDGDLYGSELRVEFHARLREEKRFPSGEALGEQIRRDIQQARAAMSEVS